MISSPTSIYVDIEDNVTTTTTSSSNSSSSNSSSTTTTRTITTPKSSSSSSLSLSPTTTTTPSPTKRRNNNSPNTTIMIYNSKHRRLRWKYEIGIMILLVISISLYVQFQSKSSLVLFNNNIMMVPNTNNTTKPSSSLQQQQHLIDHNSIHTSNITATTNSSNIPTDIYDDHTNNSTSTNTTTTATTTNHSSNNGNESMTIIMTNNTTTSKILVNETILPSLSNVTINDNMTTTTTINTTNTLQPSSSLATTTTTTTTTTTIRKPRNITLIVQLRGELGNHLSTLANAWLTKLIVEQKYPHITIQMLGQHQNDNSNMKWKHTRDDILQCFPNLQYFDFEGGIYDPEFHIIQQIQQSWLSKDQIQKLINARTFYVLDALLLQQEQPYNTTTNVVPPPQVPFNISSKYSLPYLTAQSFSWIDCLQRTDCYTTIREWLYFNTTACCYPNLKPLDTDISFHYRNYAYELRHKKHQHITMYDEVTPQLAANVLFQHRHMDHNNSTLAIDTTTSSTNHTNESVVVSLSSSNISIISRFEAGVDEFITAFHTQNISASYISQPTSGVEAFCYLLQTQHTIVGTYQSTFVRWATLLGNATMNRYYMIQNKSLSSSSNNNTIQQPQLHHNDTQRSIYPQIRVIQTIQRENRTFSIEVIET